MSNIWLEANWPAPKNIRTATTLRTGGYSTQAYASLNLAAHVGDDPERVQQNRDTIACALLLPQKPAWLTQTHSATVVLADNAEATPEADASFSHNPGVVCAVLTADCLPVLFCTHNGQSIAAAHAGWRGLLAGILSNTVDALQTSDTPLAWLGPAIGPNCFEVGSEVYQAFAKKHPNFATAFTSHKPGHYLADIYQLARIELQLRGITEIYGGEYCTFSDSARFYSFRREAKTGRMASFIWRS